jgi:hypothetical protein
LNPIFQENSFDVASFYRFRGWSRYIPHPKLLEEFPNYDVTVRGSFRLEEDFRSFGRAGKIDQKPLRRPYQHDVIKIN